MSPSAEALLSALEEATAGTPRSVTAWLNALAGVRVCVCVRGVGGRAASRARPLRRMRLPSLSHAQHHHPSSSSSQSPTAADMVDLVQSIPRRDLARLGSAAVRAVSQTFVLFIGRAKKNATRRRDACSSPLARPPSDPDPLFSQNNDTQVEAWAPLLTVDGATAALQASPPQVGRSDGGADVAASAGADNDDGAAPAAPADAPPAAVTDEDVDALRVS